MKSVIFSALLWVSSSVWIGLHVADIRGEQVARTLRAWSVAAFVIALAMRWLWRDTSTSEERLGGQIKSAVQAFALFSVCPLVWCGAVRLIQRTQSVAELAAIGSLLIPFLALLTILALESPSLRWHAIAAGLVFVMGISAFSFVPNRVLKEPLHPGALRTSRPIKKEKQVLRQIDTARV